MPNRSNLTKIFLKSTFKKWIQVEDLFQARVRRAGPSIVLHGFSVLQDRNTQDLPAAPCSCWGSQAGAVRRPSQPPGPAPGRTAQGLRYSRGPASWRKRKKPSPVFRGRASGQAPWRVLIDTGTVACLPSGLS